MATANLNRKRPVSGNPKATPAQFSIKKRPDLLRRDLFLLIRKIQLTNAVVTAAVKALRGQQAEQDEDIALVLQQHVGDALALEVEKWDGLLGAMGMKKH